jgi:hypothetical protein
MFCVDSMDGMMFGALDICPLCKSPMEYQGGSYRCRGFLSAWSKCNFSTKTLQSAASKWQIPKNSNHEYEIGVSFCLSTLSFLSLLLHINCLFYVIDSTGTFNKGVESSKSIMVCLLFAKWIENRVRSRGLSLASGLKDRATRNASVFWCPHLQHSLNNQTKIQEMGSF